MDRQRKVFTIAEVKSGAITAPIIYGLSNDDRGIFYVGQSINMKKRIFSYTGNANCHNLELGKYLSANPNFSIEILEYNPDDLSASEYAHINERVDSIFNIALNPFMEGRIRSVKPWNAGSGVRCPSYHLMWVAAKYSGKKLNESFRDVISVIKKMSDSDRCAFEISVYKDMNSQTQKTLGKWLDNTRDGMLSVMEG